MWNLDCSVGKYAANSVPADVSFLQWYYTLSANFALTNPDDKAVYRNVSITGFCDGTDNDPLVAAIICQQTAMNHPTIDGRASVVTGTGRVGDKAFFVIRLEARFAVMYPNLWPRLDLIPGCPQSIADISRFAVPTMAEIMQG
jgi:hypothetical protein